MPKISPLGQKLWPTARGQTDTQTERQTEKVNTEDPFLIFFYFIFSLKGTVQYCGNIVASHVKYLSCSSSNDYIFFVSFILFEFFLES